MIKPEIVQIHGICDNRAKHGAHVFRSDEFETHISLWDCPGVYVDCLNCDDRRCMDCVLRHWHDECEDSCPECCGEGKEHSWMTKTPESAN